MEKAQGVVVLGAGGHCSVTIDLLRQLGGYRIVGILDDNTELHGSVQAGCPVVGGTDWLGKAEFAGCVFVIGVATPSGRRAMWEKLNAAGLRAITLVHPRAYVSPEASVGEGSMVGANAAINTGARIGRGSLINTSAIVEHGCVVGDFVHVAPGAQMAGCVEIADGAFIGMGATIIEFLRVGQNATIGAGAVVLKDVAASQTVVGNPARPIKRSSDL